MGNRLQDAKTTCLMQGMMEVLGTSAARVETKVGPERLREMASTCDACTRKDDCVRWLVAPLDGPRQAPSFCLNGEALDFLAT